ncbi:hypothetical protein [Phaffia rhodozyma]|uniref:Uncharacterized protein n=1 Tax=Phaffia rhodozyma TaxID=264483 RepID=A0A0F7SKS6_PHARH|nr:hypothetical protein [Phaffia rhodozyma]
MISQVVRRSVWGFVGSLGMRTSAARPVLWGEMSRSSSRSSLDSSCPKDLEIGTAAHHIQRRDDSNSGTVSIISIVIPVVVVSLFVVIILVVQVQRRPKWNAFVRQLFSGRASAPVGTDESSTPMSVTTRSRQAVSGTAESSGPTVLTQAEINLRDARRNLAAERERRRTHGSLRSVRTLPRYREDLDESEMALMKGEAADEEDITTTDTYRRASVDSLPSNSDESPLSNHIALPAEHLAGDLVVGRNRGHSVSTVLTDITIASDESHSEGQIGGSTSTQRLILTNGWGEAPLYTEQGVPPTALQSDDSSAPAHSGTVELLNATTAANTADSDQPRRQSGYRAFFSRAGVGRTARQASDHQTLSVDDARASSGPSGARVETRPDHQQNRQPYQQHRSRNSASSIDTGGGSANPFRSSNISLLLHPTTSRSSIDMRTRLTSPSTLSISAPLPESVVRGSVYEVPRSGLTQDQMKFISSTENLNKYAIPFGESASRASFDRRRSIEPDVPPPAFDITSEGPSTSGIDGLDAPPVPSSASSASPSLSPDLPPPSVSLETSPPPSSQIPAELTIPSSRLNADSSEEYTTSSNSILAPKTSEEPSSLTTTTTSAERLDPFPEDFLGVKLSFSPLPSLELSSSPAPAPVLPTSSTSLISPTKTLPTGSVRESNESIPTLRPTPVSIEVVPPTPISVLGSARSFA